MTHPKPDEIKAARLAAGLTQTQALTLIGSPPKKGAPPRTWQNWEAGEDSPSHRDMPVAKWRLFNLLIEKATE